MPSRTRREADERFRSDLHDVLACISSDGLIVSGATSASEPPSRVLRPVSNPTRLTSSAGLALEVEHWYTVEQGSAGLWRVRTKSYIYTLRDTTGRHVLGYHWHPGGRSPVQAPHLHIYVNVSVGDRDLAKIHLPTNRIALEDVVETLIREFEVRPRRQNWASVLQRTRAVFEAERTWPRSGGA